MKKINLLLIVLLFLTSCGGLKEAGKVLRNEKIKTTDEFLVKKRNPLELPPDYKDIPEPGKLSKKEKNDDEKIKEILKVPEEENTKLKKSGSIEESILNKIRQ